MLIGVLVASSVWIVYIKTRKKPELPEIINKIKKMNRALQEADAQLFVISNHLQELYKIFRGLEK